MGDATQGEWHEWTGKAFHIRRRLSEREQASIGPAVDIRRTPEAVERARRLGDYLLFAPPDLLIDETGATAQSRKLWG